MLNYSSLKADPSVELVKETEVPTARHDRHIRGNTNEAALYFHINLPHSSRIAVARFFISSLEYDFNIFSNDQIPT